jgi:hypothetical protein
MDVQWQGVPTVEKWRTEKEIPKSGDSVAKCQERKAAAFDVGSQSVQ